MPLNNEQSAGLGKRLTEASYLSILRTNKEVLIDSNSLDKLRSINSPVIFAVTHLSNGDTTAFVHCLGRDTNIEAVIAHDSTHNNWLRIGHKIALAIAGNENFLPVSYRKRTLRNFKRTAMFNPNDYLKMKDEVEKRQKSVIMAAYYDPQYSTPPYVGQMLPRKGAGRGVPFLAALTKFPVVPVAVFVEPDHSRTKIKALLTRPAINIRVGEPLQFHDQVLDYAALGTATERREFLQGLEADSDLLINKLAMLLPEELRGGWGRSS